MTRQCVGIVGERLAARTLEDAGMRILERNWRCTLPGLRGELDLVAADGATLVVCEVKARRRAESVAPLEAVTPLKVAKLRRLAGAYLLVKGLRPDEIRLDVVAVWWPVSGGRAHVEHVRGVE